MLCKIIIERLFGLYDYNIDLTNTDGAMLKFITAPNGYGKTTLLDFIYAVISGYHHRLFSTPFKKLWLVYTDADVSSSDTVSVERIVKLKPQDKNSDTEELLSIELKFSLSTGTGEMKNQIEEYSMIQDADGEISKNGYSNNIDMFFVSRTCHYITDQRLINIKTDTTDGITKMSKMSMATYANDLKQILSDPVRVKEYEQRIEVLKHVIDRCEYANKRLEINERFGFRFVANDELETKLSLDELSSGEKHMLIQVYELLFKAQSGTLVLIDEPELSLHMMWQMNYMKNLEEIISLRNFQCIVATHSPQIFNSVWSRSVDLYTLSVGQS